MTLLADLLEKLKRITISFHMPGHHRGTGLSRQTLNQFGFLDTTELPDTDHLEKSSGMLFEAQKRAAVCFGAGKSHYLVNGSTAGILTMIYSTVGIGDTLLVLRNCHRSVLNALQISGAEPVFVYDLDTSLDNAIKNHSEAKGLLVTRPDYYGRAISIENLAKKLHQHHMLLLVDEAHGAHFVCHKAFPKTALSEGADLVVQSLHKTLPSPTQTAILHEGANRKEVKSGLPVSSIEESLSIFQTTSPSWPFMVMMDEAIEWLHTKGKQAYEELFDRMNQCINAISDEHDYSLFCNMNDTAESFSQSYQSFDKTRLVVYAPGHANELEQWLRCSHGIYIEMADENRLVFIVTPFHTEKELTDLFFVLEGSTIKWYIHKMFYQSHEYLCQHFQTKNCDSKFTLVQECVGDLHETMVYDTDRLLGMNIPKKGMEFQVALRKPSVLCSLDRAIGKISAKSIIPYPPGIPLIVPGEIISSTVVELIQAYIDRGHSVLGMEDSSVTCVIED